MKKVMAVLLMAAIALTVSGCGKEESGSSSSQTSGTASQVRGTTSEESSTVSSSSSSANTSTASEEKDTEPPSLGGIPFGQTPKELLASLKEKGIKLCDSDDDFNTNYVSISNPVKDGRTYFSDDGNPAFVYSTENEDIYFTFNYLTDKEYIIHTFTSTYSTDKGIKVGDTIKHMKEVYGSDYFSRDFGGPPNGLYYRYEQNGVYVFFAMANASYNDNDKIDYIYISSSDFPFGD